MKSLNNNMAKDFICGSFAPTSEWQKFCRRMILKLKQGKNNAK